MRVLLTGGTGFVGKRLGLELVRCGHEVVALVRSSSDLPYPAELHRWGQPGLKDIDAVIHLAGENIGAGRWTAARKAAIQKSRTETSHKLREMIQEIQGRKPQVVISASAIGFYGDRGDEELVVESLPGQGFLAETCLAWEKAVTEIRDLVPRIVFLRMGMVIGRHGGAMEKILPLFKLGVGGKLGSGQQWMSWIHLEDIVRLYIFALEEPSLDGAYNAVAPEPVRNTDFTRALAAALGVSAPFPAPAIGMKLLLGEMSELVLGSQRVKENLRARGFSFRYEKIHDAFTALTKEVEAARGPRCHEFLNEQWLPHSPEKVFAFYSDIKNLALVTPPDLRLKVVAQSTSRLAEGASYELKMQANGVPFRFRSHVLEWLEGQRFSSTQESGPFTFWLHHHSFEKLAGGTLVRNRVLYRLKFGIFGDLLGWRAVKALLHRIFSYRSARLEQLLESPPIPMGKSFSGP